MSAEVERFIEGFTGEGVESQGEFTLHSGAALRKVRERLYPSGLYYALKFVQAAVGWDSVKIWVTTKSWPVVPEIKIKCHTHGPLPSPRELIEALAQPLSLSDSPLRDLALGLFTIPSNMTYEFRLSTRERQYVFSFDGQNFVPRTGRLYPWVRPGFSVHIKGGGLCLNQEHFLIKSHCRHCGINLRLNGKSIEKPEEGALVERLVEGECNRILGILPPRRKAKPVDHGRLHLRHPRSSFLMQASRGLKPGRVVVNRAYWLNREARGLNQVVLLHRGVEVERVQVGGPPIGAVALVDCEGLEFDLGGFSLQKASLEPLLVEVKANWEEMCRDVEPYLCQLPFPRAWGERLSPLAQAKSQGDKDIHLHRHAVQQRVREYLGQPSVWEEMLAKELKSG